MISSRRYSIAEYLNSIQKYPDFWKSLKQNLKAPENYSSRVNNSIDKLKNLYPNLKTSKIYFTVGANRSLGTGIDSLVLMGSEFVLGNSKINTSNIPQYLQDYYSMNPSDYLELFTTHEYIHTQQNNMVYNTLHLVLYEGIAEFVASIVSKQKPPYSAFSYGEKNEQYVKQRFEEDLFNRFKVGLWLWNSKENEFGVNDLGYFVGFKIAENFYNKSKDKMLAIKQLIELNYNDDKEVYSLLDASGYLSKKPNVLQRDFEARRPTVIKVHNIDNTSKIILEFSEPMSINKRSFDYSPLGKEAVVKFKKEIGYSNDLKTYSFEIEKLKPNKHYQIIVGSSFRSEENYPLIPYLIEFRTSKKY